uniref:Zinc finger MYND domain-containing protein 15 n=1 Tax=Anthurium amnicola TaxID=1678845 RepID=A0A1D1YAI4_9ARAE
MEMHLKELFSRYQEQFGTGPGLGPSSGTCLLRVDAAPPAFVRSLYRASAALFRTDPWRRLRPPHLLGVRVGKDADWGKRQPFPCAQFVGGDGGDLGLHLFRSEQDALRATAPRETHRVPNLELLRLVFLPDSLLSPSNRRMVRSLSLEAAGGPDDARFPVVDVARFTPAGGVRFRNPSLEELRYLYAFMKAAALLHPLLTAAEEAPRRGRLLAFDPFIETVDVEWPPEVARGWDLVAVTISHPPGEPYSDERRPTLSPTRYLEPPREEPPDMDVKAVQWAAPRQCAMCDKDVHGEQSLCCGRCRAVVYCSPMCQKQQWKETHRGLCGLYKAMMEREEELSIKIFAFPCLLDHPCRWLESVGVHHKGMWRRKCGCYSHCPYGLLPTRNGGHSESWGAMVDGDYPPDSAFPNYMDGVSSNNPAILLSGWSEYYSLRSLPMSSPVAAILSHPLTVYHILTALAIDSKNRLVKGREVIVHYLGPEVELDWIPAFMEIGHLLNVSGNVQIFMVGPEVPSNLSGTATGTNSRVKVNLVRGVYQEEASCLPIPNVVLALNCGLDTHGSWGGTLEQIKSLDVPAFFTDRSEVACSSAKQVLRGSGLYITHPVTPNPFRSPVQDRMPSSNLPSFSNCFVFGVNT